MAATWYYVGQYRRHWMGERSPMEKVSKPSPKGGAFGRVDRYRGNIGGQRGERKRKASLPSASSRKLLDRYERKSSHIETLSIWPLQLYLIKNDWLGSVRVSASIPLYFSFISLYIPLLIPLVRQSTTGTFRIPNFPLAPPVFRVGLIKLNEPSHRGIASQLRYFLCPYPH